MPVFNRNRHSGSSGGVAAAYTIDNSIRLNDDDSAYMHRVIGSDGDSKQGTFSLWVKRGNLAINTTLLEAAESRFYFTAADKITHYLERPSRAKNLTTTAVYRDPSAWQHIFCNWDTTPSTPESELWVNGVQVSSFSTNTNNLSQNDSGTYWDSGKDIQIGRIGTGSLYFDGYIAELHGCDGLTQAVTDFGEFDSNGNWVPIEYAGAHGDEGFYLDFAVAPGTGNGAGTDVSGNANHFTDSGLASNDQTTDSPTDDADNNVGNYCTWSPINRLSSTRPALSDGNLKTTGVSGSGGEPVNGTIATTEGKWYYEVKTTGSLTDNGTYYGLVTESPYNDTSTYPGFDTNASSWGANLRSTGTVLRIYHNNSGADRSISATPTTSDYICVAWDSDNNDIWFGWHDTTATTTYWINNSGSEVSTFPDDSPTFDNVTAGYLRPQCAMYNSSSFGEANFGQFSFVGTAPTGFKKLNTANLAAPAAGGDPSKYFQVDTFTGTGSELVRTLTDAAGSAVKPDLVWIKDRDSTVEHVLTDSARGATKEINSDSNNIQSTVAQGLKSFDTSGFTLGTDGNYNTSSSLNVAWCWNTQGGAGASNEDGSINTTTTSVGTTQGFSISTYTGTGSAATIGHGLGAKPEFICVKDLGVANGWTVYHHKNTSAPETDILVLNSDGATSDTTDFNDTLPTTSVFSIGTGGGTNGSGDTYISYAWVGVEGYSKFGSYEGNGVADGTFIWTGFAPKLILVKGIDATTNWVLKDTERNTYNVSSTVLYPNDSRTEASIGSKDVDILSNGFKLRTNQSDYNSSNTYVYAAWAEFPSGGDGVSQARAR